MKRAQLKNLTLTAVLSASFGMSYGVHAQAWKLPDYKKKEVDAPPEKFQRRRVDLFKSTQHVIVPIIEDSDVGVEKARLRRLEQANDQLISELESLVKRPGQKERVGELQMRLAELYYEKGQAIAAREGETWERAVLEWENLSADERVGKARPVLRTPQADQFRQRAMGLYQQLEKKSRGGDFGRSQMIRRDEVLFFIGSTYVELRKKKDAIAPLNELVSKFSQSSRIFEGRMLLADALFDINRFRDAVPHYLEVVKQAQSRSENASAPQLQTYALYKLGWCYFNTGDYDKAVSAYLRTAEVSEKLSGDRRVSFQREAHRSLLRSYPLAGKFNEGEGYFERLGDRDLLIDYYRSAADIARDKSRFALADRYYLKLVEMIGDKPEARDAYLEYVENRKRLGDTKKYVEAIESLIQRFGAESSWIGRQDKANRELAIQEIVQLIRVEAKFHHNVGQKRNNNAELLKAEQFYALYAKYVPEPNADEPSHVHEMNFYRGELMFRLQRYPQAAAAYQRAGGIDGKYKKDALYNRIVALELATRSQPDLRDQMDQAILVYAKAFPDDTRVSEFGARNAYATASRSFEKGDTEQALKELQIVIQEFPKSPLSREAAERVLFILEKEKDFEKLTTELNRLEKNSQFMSQLSAQDKTKFLSFRERGEFNRLESLPQNSPSERKAKAEQFFTLSQQATLPDVKSKALTNARVFAYQSDDSELKDRVNQATLKANPTSQASRDIRMELADRKLFAGDWDEAVKQYEALWKTAQPEQKEKALWNMILVQSYREDLWWLRQDGASMSAKLKGWMDEYLKLKISPDKRRDVLRLLVMDRAHGAAALKLYGAELRRMSAGAEVVADAEVLQPWRAKRQAEFAKILAQNPPRAERHPVVKGALGEMKFRAVEPAYQEYLKTKLNYRPAQFAKSIERKLAKLEGLKKRYLEVVAYGDGSSAFRSLDRMAEIYGILASDIEKMPGVAKADLAPFTDPLRQESRSLIETCLSKAVEFRVYGGGLTACQRRAQSNGWITSGLTIERLPEPRVSGALFGSGTLTRKAGEAAARNQFGLFELGLRVAQDQSEMLSSEDQAAVDWNRGVALFRQGAFSEALSLWIRAGEGSRSLKNRALEAVGALLLQVGDFASALRYLDGVDGDFAFELRALASMGLKQFDNAVRFYEKTKLEGDLRFYLALAQYESGKKDQSISTLQTFVDRSSPPGNHPAREQLKRWRTSK